MRKRIFALGLTLCMMLGMATNAFAAGKVVKTKKFYDMATGRDEIGSCTLTDDGVLTVSVQGKIGTWHGNVFPKETRIAIFESGVTEIECDAFGRGESAPNGCTELTKVVVPDTLVSIMHCNQGPSLWKGTTKFMEFEVSEDNPFYYDIDGVLFSNRVITENNTDWPWGSNFDSNTIIKKDQILRCLPQGRTGIYSIPEGTTMIGYAALVDSQITSLVIPKSVTEIGELAFFGCKNLTDIYYNGSKSDWENIKIDNDIGYFGEGDPLEHINIHYNANGWQQKGENWYYNQNAKAVTGWQQVDGTWYYFSDSGIMQTGWLQDGSTWYYLNSSGAMATGWISVDGVWYYLNGSGAMQTGWLDDGAWYYLNDSGSMATGWASIDDVWYYLNSSGAMQTGWLDDGAWYYLNDSGAMATGWVSVDGVWYYLTGSGAMATGWANVDGTWYYLNSSGAMQTGWLNDGGTWYYLDASGAWVE